MRGFLTEDQENNHDEKEITTRISVQGLELGNARCKDSRQYFSWEFATATHKKFKRGVGALTLVCFQPSISIDPGFILWQCVG